MLKSIQKTLDVPIRQDLIEFLDSIFGDKNKIPFKEVNLNKEHIIYLFYLLESLESYSFTFSEINKRIQSKL